MGNVTKFLILSILILLISSCEKKNIDIEDTEDVEIVGYINVTKPTSSDIWGLGFLTIEWESNVEDSLSIILFDSILFIDTIKKNIPNSGYNFWNFSDTLSTGSNYRVKVSSNIDSSLSGFSEYFTIVKDESVEYLMTSDDYQIIVSYIENHEILFGYLDQLHFNVEFYYGASSYYQNFDMRLSKRRENDPLEFLVGLSDGDARIEIVNRLPEAINLVLIEKFPNAEPSPYGVDIFYSINYETYEDDYYSNNYIARFKCINTGEFEYVETVSVE